MSDDRTTDLDGELLSNEDGEPFVPEPPVYTFRARLRDGPYVPAGPGEVWREIELAGNQTLGDLAEAILDAFEFDEDHLWSFFLSGKAWDESTEYGISEPPGFDWLLDPDVEDEAIEAVGDDDPELKEALAFLAPLAALPPAMQEAMAPALARLLELANEFAEASQGKSPAQIQELDQEFAQRAAAMIADLDEPTREALLAGMRLMTTAAEARAADERDPTVTLLRDVPYPGKTGKKEFLFLFDYGDEWRFGVKLLRVSPTLEPGAQYPRLVAQAGEAPPQYPDLDEE